MTKRGFITITNRDIYDKLEEVCQHVQRTNGKVKLNAILSRTALVLAILSISILTGINLVQII